MEFRSDINVSQLDIPDDVTIPQFIFDTAHRVRPQRNGAPWLIQDETGKKFWESEVCLGLSQCRS